MKALGYVRVSLEDENPVNQRIAIEEFCRREGIELIHIFEDVGVSGSKPAFEREVFRKLLEVSKLLNIKTIVVYDLTRLGRDLFDVIETYRKLLEEGYTILFVKHPELNARPDNPVGEALRKAILALLGIAAELERAFIRERTRQGMERAKREGKHVGRPPYPFPREEIEYMLRQGMKLAEIYRLLVSQRKLCRRTTDGRLRCMSYETFRRKIRKALRHRSTTVLVGKMSHG